jgi:hypothetical protein
MWLRVEFTMSKFNVFIALLSLSLAPLALADSSSAAAPDPSGNSAAASDGANAVSSSSENALDRWLTTAPVWGAKFDRWVDLREMDFSVRYRSVFDSNNAHEYNQGQQRSIIDGKFKLDRKGKYGLVFHASTGKYFNWAYADFIGGGTEKGYNAEYQRATPLQRAAADAYLTPERILVQGASGGWAMYVRRLYLDLEPVPGIEVQYGSMDINRGAASEITTYDNDGYIMGERLLIKRPKNLFFDEASVTYAYFGDLYTPNLFSRGDRLVQANYHQFLVRKVIAKRLNASFDYTWQNKSNTFRQAAEIKIPEIRILDSARVETYERQNAISFQQVVDFAPGGKGYAVTLTKKNMGPGHRLSLDGGYAHIDAHQAVLTQSETSATFCMGINGDAYGLGVRFFVRPTIKLTPYLDVIAFYTHEIGQFTVMDQMVWNKQALNAGLNFDIKKAFFQKSQER